MDIDLQDETTEQNRFLEIELGNQRKKTEGIDTVKEVCCCFSPMKRETTYACLSFLTGVIFSSVPWLLVIYLNDWFYC